VTNRPVDSLIALRPEARDAPRAAAPRSPDAAVLLVDDRPENLLALDAVLAPLAARLGVRLLWARSADEALRHALAEGDRLAVVLLDVMMPGTDGPATARLLRARARTAQVPIVFVTALDADATRLAAAYGAGGVDYVAKPIDADVLRAKVAAFVDLHRERAAAGAAVRRDLLDRERAAQAAAERERADAERTTGRMRRLLALTEALTAAATPDDVARALVAQGVAALGAGAGVLALLTAPLSAPALDAAAGAPLDGGPPAFEVVHAEGYPETVVDPWRRFPADAPTPLGDAVRTGAPVVLATPADRAARYPQLETALQAFPCSVSLPLVVEDSAGRRVLGAVGVSFGEARPVAPDDVGLLAAMAGQAAIALERTRLLAAEREARARAELAADRTRRLQALTARLNEAASREQIADVLFESGLAALGAEAGSLALVHADAAGAPAEFEIVRDAGFQAPVVARYRRFPVTPGRPLSEAVRRRAPVFVTSPDEWRARWPDAPEDLSALGYAAFAAVPVCAGERVLAAIAFSFRAPRAFDDATRTLLATLGEQCALALERQRLHEAELHQAERHAALLATIEDAFVAYDRELRFTYVNPHAAALLARPADALLGQRLPDVVPETRGSPVYEAIRGTLATGQGTQLEAYSAATRCWLDVRVYPAPDGVSVVFRDITARRRAQDAASFMAEASRLLAASLDYEATLRALADAAVPRLGDWCAVDVVEAPSAGAWPPRVERLAAVHRDPAVLALGAELTRRYPTDWSAGDGLPAVLRDGRTLFIPEVTDAMLVARARDAEHLALLRALRFSSLLVVPLVARGLTLGALTLCATESGRRYSEADRALAEELAGRAATAVDNARLYREAERARAEAEAANAAKGQFLAVMSHELRTPLNAIGGYTELMELGVHGPVTDAQRNALARVQGAQRRLLALINDVLNYAKLEGGRVEYDVRAVDVREVVAEVTPLIEPQLAAKGLALEVRLPDAPRPVWADREKLGQVLVNLLSNAVKFTDARHPATGAPGRVTVHLLERAGPDATESLSVTDTGRGIAAAQQERIFEPFVQVARGYTSPDEGTGLGLAISRDLARGMGGDLRVRSTPGEGSAFTITLRCAPQAPPAGGPPR